MTNVSKLYTIGYGGRKPDELVSLLQSIGVRAVVDVRLRPDRAAMGAYTRAKTRDKGIERLLGSVDPPIEYVSVIELGNLFLDLPEWREPYRELLERAGHLLCHRLDNVPRPYCLLCAERDPAACHRSMIANVLSTQGWDVEDL